MQTKSKNRLCLINSEKSALPKLQEVVNVDYNYSFSQKYNLGEGAKNTGSLGKISSHFFLFCFFRIDFFFSPIYDTHQMRKPKSLIQCFRFKFPFVSFHKCIKLPCTHCVSVESNGGC